MLTHADDKRIIEFGVGLTDLVKRSTRTVEEIERQEFAEGRILLAQKIEEFAPRVVAFNGKFAYEKFAQQKCQPRPAERRAVWRESVRAALHERNWLGRRGVKSRYFRQLAALLAKAPAGLTSKESIWTMPK